MSRHILGPDDVKEGELRAYPVGRRSVLVSRHQGRLVALDNWCNHAGCLLSGGWVERGQVVCPCHEIGFDLVTGKNVTSPGIADDQPVYPLEIVDGQVVVLDFPEA